MANELGTDIWNEALGRLRTEVDEENFDTWLRTARFRALDEDTLHIEVPSAFNQSWLTRNFRDRIANAVQRITDRPIEIDFHVASFGEEPLDTESIPATSIAESPVLLPASQPLRSDPTSEKSVVRLENTELCSRYTFESFIVGESNRFAHAACRAIAEPDTEAWNPLLIWGGVGLGKTHLLHATGHAFLKQSPEARVRFVSSEWFMNGFVQAIRQDNIAQFREEFRSVDLLLLDDVQFIFGKEGTQNEFFHTFNELHSRHKKIVLSCDRPPSEMMNIEERLRSRFEWGLTVDVQAPDLETRLAILHQKAEMHGYQLPNDVALFIAERIKTNIRKLEGVLTNLCHHWRLTGEPISMESVRQVLGHLVVVDDEPQCPSIERIQAASCDYFGITKADLIGRERHKKVTVPRHLAMYLSRLLTDQSFPEIAQHFGGRNHTSIMHAYRKVEKELLHNAHLQNLTNYLAKKIQKGSE